MVTNNKISMLLLLSGVIQLNASLSEMHQTSSTAAEGSGSSEKASFISRTPESVRPAGSLIMTRTTEEVYEAPLATSPQRRGGGRRMSLNSSSDGESSFLGADSRLHELIKNADDKGTDFKVLETKIDALLASNSFLLNSLDSEQRTPLYYAVAGGKLELVKYLIEVCAADARLFFEDEKTVLDVAIDAGNVEMARFLALFLPLHIANGAGELPFVRIMQIKDAAIRDKMVKALLAGNFDFLKYEQADGTSALKLAEEIAAKTGNLTLKNRLAALINNAGDVDKMLSLMEGTHAERVAALSHREKETEKPQNELVSAAQTQGTWGGTLLKGTFGLGLAAAVAYFAFKAGQDSVDVK